MTKHLILTAEEAETLKAALKVGRDRFEQDLFLARALGLISVQANIDAIEAAQRLVDAGMVEQEPVGTVNHYSQGSVGVSGRHMLALPHGAKLYAHPLPPVGQQEQIPKGYRLVKLTQQAYKTKRGAVYGGDCKDGVTPLYSVDDEVEAK